MYCGATQFAFIFATLCAFKDTHTCVIGLCSEITTIGRKLSSDAYLKFQLGIILKYTEIISMLGDCLQFSRLVMLTRRSCHSKNAHLKPDLEAFSLHEMALTLNIHIPLLSLLTALVVCICQVSGVSKKKFIVYTCSIVCHFPKLTLP